MIKRFRNVSTSHSLVLVIILMTILGCDTKSVPTIKAELDDFQVSLVEAGTISAVNSVTVNVPKIRRSMQIVWLIEEGLQVEEGDTLVIFDRAEVGKQIEDQQADLDIAISNYNKGEATLLSELENLRSGLEFDSISWQLSKLRRERTQYESEVARQEAELQFYQSTLSLEKSRSRHKAQISINEQELHTLSLKVEQAQALLAKVMLDYDAMVLKAPQLGMVVLLPIWKGDRMGKIKVGDSPWRGAALIELPDFSKMQVELQIDEVDFNLVHTGDSCNVVLDAWPDKNFPGRVSEIGVLAREKSDDSRLKGFDVVITLDGIDGILKPGMNARCTIFGVSAKDVISLPVECLFRDTNGWYVFLKSGNEFNPTKVNVGHNSGDRVIISDSLFAGDIVSLVNIDEWNEEQNKSGGN
jgi:HlyD family secretion protein